MRSLLIIPLDRKDEVAIARYTLQAAHARRGACLVLDVRRARDVASTLPELCAEFSATARGNDQDFALLGASVDEVSSFASLGEALEALAPGCELPFELELVLPSRLDDLPALREFLAVRTRRLHPEAQDFELAMLVDEICQNAIQNSPSNKSHYEVVYHADRRCVRLDVSNQSAESFVPERIMQRRLESFDPSGQYLGERGRGLFLIARLADDLQIRTDEGDRITVSVTKRLGDEPCPVDDGTERAEESPGDSGTQRGPA